MAISLGVFFTVSAVKVHPSPSHIFKKKINFSLRAKSTDDNDPLFEAAIERASFRFQESHRVDPLFLDPYAGCLVSSDVQMDMNKVPRYCLATKFIDDKLLSTLKLADDLRQVVLFTDGMDTRPYRLNWPRSTTIYDISPQRVFETASLKLEDAGAKIGRTCLFLHVPSESSNIEEILRSKGFRGTRPSIWAFQGLPLVNLARLNEILLIISNLASKGCLLLGELPTWFSEAEVGTKTTKKRWMEKLFMSNGFHVDMIGYDEVARNFGKVPADEENENILIIAEQLRFSDDQMDVWRREVQRIDEEADEEGFEEL